MEEIKQDWLSLVEKAVFQEPSSYENSLYSKSARRLQATSLTADKCVNFVSSFLNALTVFVWIYLSFRFMPAFRNFQRTKQFRKFYVISFFFHY